MQQLTVKQRQFLKGLAHDLQPVVMIGNNGVTESVLKEIDTSLNAHELIKIRVLGDERAAREAIIEDLCGATNSSFVQHIGKLIVLYRASEKARIVLPKI
ncbi:MAG TPA: ribosome assembly RNA-binding protein YhbY [Burkholderiales bacterium]|jgi:RNA-binding protein|nr:ribosome assembly RNA-binding protein YhbY [Burkholderiales bacterium]